MERNDVFEKVKEFMIREFFVDNIEITHITTIERDLGSSIIFGDY